MKSKIYFLVIVCITILPKINIINIPGNDAGIRVEDLLIVVLFIYYLNNIFIKKKIIIENIIMKKVIKIFACYILITLISSIFGVFNNYVKPMLALLYFLRKIEYFLMIFVGYDIIKNNIFDTDKIENFFKFTVIFHFIISLLQLKGIVGSFNKGQALGQLTQGRVSSTFNGAYELSAYLLLILPYFLYNIFKNKKYTIKNFLYIILIAICIYSSESRTSLIILLVIIALMFSKFERDLRVKLLTINILCLIGILAIFYSFNINLQDTRFASVNIKEMAKTTKIAWNTKNFENYVLTGSWYGNNNLDLEKEADASYSTRVHHWMQLIDGVLKSPILGVGASISGGSADGNYIRILAESGILGIYTWIYMNYIIIKNAKGKIAKNKSMVIVNYALISMLLGSIFIDVFESSKVMMTMWFLIGISFATEDKENNNNINKETRNERE